MLHVCEAFFIWVKSKLISKIVFWIHQNPRESNLETTFPKLPLNLHKTLKHECQKYICKVSKSEKWKMNAFVVGYK